MRFKGITFLLSLLFFLITLQGCFRIKGSDGGGQVKNVKERTPDPRDVSVPDGFELEVVSTGFTFPTDVTFSEDGTPYVVESGYSYGEEWTEPKLLRINEDGTVTEIVSGGKNGPWNGVTYNEGYFYIAEGGELEGGKILKADLQGNVTELVSDLPSMGDHHTNAPVVNDGYVYFAQGTATNSAVVGKDNADYGWLHRYEEFHDVPCRDIAINNINYVTENPLTEEENDEAVTGPFLPFNTAVEEDGQVIPGQVPCSGAIMRVPVNGGEPELVAWGLRNPYGMTISESGRMYVTENGADVRGSRPLWGVADVLWELEEGSWYGWPDYVAGRPVSGRDEFVPPSCDTIAKLLKEDPGTPPEPLAELGVHSSSNGLDIIQNSEFGRNGDLLIAQFGDMAPEVGKVWKPVGFRVVQVNPETGVITEYIANKAKKNGPASWLENDGLERPVSVKFNSGQDELFIVDFGVLAMNDSGPVPYKNSGVIWKLTKAE